ncbi:hypothetical protein CC2G_004434 [Coprinopsis cinerea AmutBmut pab1-1]|nr:hypothetical protein CC2G_004434 [Coprinopsis cinerea AmutBmut pab1-1]
MNLLRSIHKLVFDRSMPPNMPSPRFGLVSTTLALGALLFGAARAAIPTPLPTAVDPTPSPLVPLGGQCGGITYKGPTGCAQIPGKTVACVVVDPCTHQVKLNIALEYSLYFQICINAKSLNLQRGQQRQRSPHRPA